MLSFSEIDIGVAIPGPTRRQVRKKRIRRRPNARSGDFREILKSAEIWAFYGDIANLKVRKNRFGIMGFFRARIASYGKIVMRTTSLQSTNVPVRNALPNERVGFLVSPDGFPNEPPLL